MSTSDIKRNRILYLAAALFVLVFAFIYESFSHNVYSAYMIGAFLIPTGGFIISEFFIAKSRKYRLKTNTHFQCLGAATTWLTLGSIFAGVLEIYGTTNSKIIIFAIVGAVLLIISFVSLANAIAKSGYHRSIAR